MMRVLTDGLRVSRETAALPVAVPYAIRRSGGSIMALLSH